MINMKCTRHGLVKLLPGVVADVEGIAPHQSSLEKMTFQHQIDAVTTKNSGGGIVPLYTCNLGLPNAASCQWHKAYES